MPGNDGVYAVKKRKKPVQKSVKPLPVKTNPSKRHRDRLNGELERLTAMLPFSEEVRGRLDKLSVLRLSVGFLKVKSYFHAALQKSVGSAPRLSADTNGQTASLDGVTFSEGELLLQALNGFVLVVTTDGTVFYTSPTIQDFLGFHQSDVVHQSVFDLVHTDDREMFRRQLHFALDAGDATAGDCVSLLPQHLPPENSSFLERSFCCRLRCLLDNTSGFLALNFSGRLKYLHLQGPPGGPGGPGAAAPPQLALFAIATPLQPPSVMEIRTKTFIFQTKHRMDFAPVGIDTRGKLVLGYSEMELVATGSGYQFIHAADMMYCADNHLRMIKTGDSGFTFFRLLTKTGHWLWVQATARLVYKGGRPDFIIARQKALTNEEGEEHLQQRRQQLPFNLASGEGLLYDISLESIPGPPPPPAPPGSGAPRSAAESPAAEKPLDPASLLGSLRRQDHSVYTRPQEPGPRLPIFTQMDDPPDFERPSLEQAFLDSHALLSVPGQIHAAQKRSSAGDAMIESLEQILRDIGAIEGLEVEETELRDWEDTLVRMSGETEDVPEELNRILANDVFSYVEEALRTESGADQVSGSIDSLSIRGQRRFSGNEWQQATEECGFAERQALLGDVFCGCSSGLKSQVASQRAKCRHRDQASSPWPPSGSDRRTIPTQQTWLPSGQNVHNHSQQTFAGPPLQGPSVWQQLQLQHSFHHHTLTHSSHTPGGGSGVNSTAPSFQQTQPRLSGSCMFEKREGHMPSAQNGPLLKPASGGNAHAVFVDRGVPPDVRGSVHVSGDDGRSEYPPENTSLQSSFFCWNSEAQIPRVPLSAVADPFVFPVRPAAAGSLNLSQNTGS